MAKAGIVYVGTTDGLVTYSDPGGSGRWRRVGQQLAGQAVQAMLADDALTLLVVAGDSTALRTADGGQTWEAAPEDEAASLLALAHASGPVVATAQGPAQWRGIEALAPDATALAMLSGREEILLAATAHGTTLARSEDGGTTWIPATIKGGLRGAVRTITPASYHMDIAWAGTDAGQLLRSDDRGRTWQEIGAEAAGILSLAVVRLA